MRRVIVARQRDFPGEVAVTMPVCVVPSRIQNGCMVAREPFMRARTLGTVMRQELRLQEWFAI